MPAFDDETISTASPRAVWKVLYDPMRFPEWWAGVQRVARGDANGGKAEVTLYPQEDPDFPLPQLVETRAGDQRVVVSCTVSDLVFDWRLHAHEHGTHIGVHVEIPEREHARLTAQQHVIGTSLRRLAELAETDPPS